MSRVHVFLRDNAFDMKAGIVLLDSSSATCFIHTIQLMIKDSLFSENKISVITIVSNFNHLSTVCESKIKVKKSRSLKVH